MALMLWPHSTEAGLGRVNEPAPPVELERILQAPPGVQVSWDSLRGKAVVLEFWSTWCGPCVQAIGHLNELVDELGHEPIQFISVSDEKEATIAGFLEKRPMAGWIGLDTDRSVFQAYGIVGLPETVLVDGRGIVRARTRPHLLSAEILRDLMAGRSLGLPETDLSIPGPEAILGGNDVEPLFQVSIRPSATGRQWGQFSAKQYLMGGTTLAGALPFAYQMPSTRIAFEAAPSGIRYDIAVLTAGREDLVRPLLRQALEATFQIQARREVREQEVHVLVKGEGAGGHGRVRLPNRERQDRGSQHGGGRYRPGSGERHALPCPG